MTTTTTTILFYSFRSATLKPWSTTQKTYPYNKFDEESGLGMRTVVILHILMYLISYTCSFWLRADVFGAPIQPSFKLDFGKLQPPPDLMRELDTDVAEVNKQIHNMRYIVDCAKQCDRECIGALVDIFGRQYNLDRIEGMLTKLETTTVRVENYWDKGLGESVAEANFKKQVIWLGNGYWECKDRSRYVRFWTLIHETTHLFGTSDVWDWTDASKTTLRVVNPRKAGPDALVGYAHMHYYRLMQQLKADFYLNADAWAVFGYYALNHWRLPSEIQRGLAKFPLETPAAPSSQPQGSKSKHPTLPRAPTPPIQRQDTRVSTPHASSMQGYVEPHASSRLGSQPPLRQSTLGSRRQSGSAASHPVQPASPYSHQPAPFSFDFSTLCAALPKTDGASSSHSPGSRAARGRDGHSGYYPVYPWPSQLQQNAPSFHASPSGSHHQPDSPYSASGGSRRTLTRPGPYMPQYPKPGYS
ncbi:hypothetical protein CVT24_003260 [Panaeolus cyanescens]|uniref:Uncharacterized protein n=1 Tax=Panaeolus cyanescens TaxID=181874 RepID=A0A409YXL6_9AGAR|nr:hypothetical protein CVT24_003260 [Panaeolus cyanescens]